MKRFILITVPSLILIAIIFAAYTIYHSLWETKFFIGRIVSCENDEAIGDARIEAWTARDPVSGVSINYQTTSKGDGSFELKYKPRFGVSINVSRNGYYTTQTYIKDPNETQTIRLLSVTASARYPLLQETDWVNNCTVPENASPNPMTTEADIDICDRDLDCIISTYTNCFCLEKRPINSKYDRLYRSRPDWNSFQDNVACSQKNTTCPSYTGKTVKCIATDGNLKRCKLVDK